MGGKTELEQLCDRDFLKVASIVNDTGFDLDQSLALEMGFTLVEEKNGKAVRRRIPKIKEEIVYPTTVYQRKGNNTLLGVDYLERFISSPANISEKMKALLDYLHGAQANSELDAFFTNDICTAIIKNMHEHTKYQNDEERLTGDLLFDTVQRLAPFASAQDRYKYFEKLFYKVHPLRVAK